MTAVSAPGTSVWTPGTAYLENSRVAQFARAHGAEGIAELRSRSVADVAWHRDAVVADLGLRFTRPYDSVLDLSRGITDPDWFVGGELNTADACLTRWAEDPQSRDRTAVVHEAATHATVAGNGG